MRLIDRLSNDCPVCPSYNLLGKRWCHSVSGVARPSFSSMVLVFYPPSQYSLCSLWKCQPTELCFSQLKAILLPEGLHPLLHKRRYRYGYWYGSIYLLYIGGTAIPLAVTLYLQLSSILAIHKYFTNDMISYFQQL